MFSIAMVATWSLPVPQPPASQACWMLPLPSSLWVALMRISHPSFHALIIKKRCQTTFTACNTPRRMHLMQWISRRPPQRLQRTDGGSQNVWLLWLVPSHPWGGVICTPPIWLSVSQSWRLVSVWWYVIPRYLFLWCLQFAHYQEYACRKGPWYWL